MTKSDLIWVVIRSSGILLILRALFAAKDVASALLLLKYGGGPPGSDFARMWTETMSQQFADATITGVFSLVVGLYLLRGGGWIHRLINYVGRERSNSTPHHDARECRANEPPSERAGERGR